MAVTASLLGNLSVTDNQSGSVAMSILVNLAFAGSIESYGTINTSTSPLTVNLPVNPTQFLYIKNTDTVNSVIVTWTPNGSTSHVIQTVDAGGTIFFCQNTTTNGISALSVQASAGTPAIQYVLLG